MLKVRTCDAINLFRLIVVKNSLINECTQLATGQNVVTVWGVWGSNPGHNLTPTEANQCVSSKDFPVLGPTLILFSLQESLEPRLIC